MHLADGILTEPALVVGLDLVGAGAVAVAARRADVEGGRGAAWTGMLAAFVLSAQALNVPLLPGTSAHVIGASLVCLLLGPARAIVTMSAVLLVQALLLGDGGITVLGLNVIDMAVIPACAVAAAARVFGHEPRGLVLTAFFGTLLASLLGGACLGAALVAGAHARASVALPWLVGAQGLAGLAEGALTAVAVRELGRRSPHLLSAPGKGAPEAPRPGSALAWAAIAVGVLTALLPFASSSPDALERLLPRIAARP